jgi:hypothetical protein
MKGWKKIYQANGPWKQAGVAIHINDKVDFKPTLIKWDKESHSILIKQEKDQKEITIINLYEHKVNKPNFIKRTLKDLKAYINSNRVVVGDILDLKYTIDQMDLVAIYRIFHPTSTQYTFFSTAHWIFFKIDYILGYKAILNKYTMHSIWSQCNKTRTQQQK